MDWINLNGKVIEAVYFPDSGNEAGRRVKYDIDANVSLRLHAEYLGDRTEAWIVVTRNGEEDARHNARYAESIVWATDGSPALGL